MGPSDILTRLLDPAEGDRVSPDECEDLLTSQSSKESPCLIRVCRTRCRLLHHVIPMPPTRIP